MNISLQVALITALLVLCMVILLRYLIRLYNSLIFMRNNAEKAFANIDVILHQRLQEIPNQRLLVKGASKHEKALLNDLAVLRENSGTDELSTVWPKRLHHLNKFFSKFKRLTLHEEDYPSLTSSDVFNSFQKRILEFENMIAESRAFYNDCATLFNDKLMLVPNRQLMTPFGLVELELMHRINPIKR